MRGRRPSPKAKLRLVGAYRQDRHGNSPDPPKTPAQSPKWLKGQARKHWPEVAAVLTAMRLNSSGYSIATALLCDALADFIHFSKLARKEPPVIKSEKGNAFQNPIFSLKNKSWERVLKCCREFGMSPAALRGIEIPQGSPVDELDGVLA